MLRYGYPILFLTLAIFFPVPGDTNSVGLPLQSYYGGIAHGFNAISGAITKLKELKDREGTTHYQVEDSTPTFTYRFVKKDIVSEYLESNERMNRLRARLWCKLGRNLVMIGLRYAFGGMPVDLARVLHRDIRDETLYTVGQPYPSSYLTILREVDPSTRGTHLRLVFLSEARLTKPVFIRVILYISA